MKLSIVKLDNIPENLECELKKDFELIDATQGIPDNYQTICSGVTIGIANGESRLSAEHLENFSSLRLISVFGVGYDGIDMTYLKKQNITLTNTPDVLTDDVADLALTFCLALSRELIPAHNFVRDGKWSHSRYPLTSKFSKCRVGIFGLGRVGQAIYNRLSAFNCDVYYTDSSTKDIPAKRVDSIHLLAEKVDILIIAANASAYNIDIIDKDVLAALGNKGYLVNISRGSLIKQTDLISALENRIIAGAALDVLASEPDVPPELFRPNVILTPHYASGTAQTRKAMEQLVLDNIHAFIYQGQAVTPVNQVLCIPPYPADDPA